METRVPVSGALMEPARAPPCTRVCAQPGALTTLGGCVPTVGSSHTGLVTFVLWVSCLHSGAFLGAFV